MPYSSLPYAFPPQLAPNTSLGPAGGVVDAVGVAVAVGVEVAAALKLALMLGIEEVVDDAVLLVLAAELALGTVDADELTVAAAEALPEADRVGNALLEAAADLGAVVALPVAGRVASGLLVTLTDTD